MPEPPPPNAERQALSFRAAGFSRPEEGAATWARIESLLPREHPFRALWPETWRHLLRSADPEIAFGLWVRWVEADLREGEGKEGKEGGRAARWAASRSFREGFLSLAGVSPALGERLLVLWEEFDPDAWQSGWETRSSLGRRLDPLLQGAGDREFLDRIRRFQQLEALRIAYLDCLRDVKVELVTLQISSLADVLIAASFERALAQVAERRRLVAPQQGFAVCALGKLGGLELNYSSDVDLIFIYDEGVKALEAADGARLEDPYEIERFFTQVAERIVQHVTTFTERGRLYRLDARLRPGGGSGRLVWSARASIDYYYSQGRAWERQALIRLRPVAGDFALAERMRRELRAFVFPGNLTTEEIAEIRGLKLQMEKLAEDRGPSETQIKIGRGGIRDVEYIVQFLQLVHGHKLPALQAANIFTVLESLAQAGLLTPEEADVLRRGYRFLRLVEHRVQMMHLLQTHRLPSDPLDLLRLARGLGFGGAEEFRTALARHGADIRRVFRLRFEEATALRPAEEGLPALFELPLDSAEEAGVALLAPYGFQDPRAAFQRLRALSGAGVKKVTLDAGRSQAVFARLHEKLLREISRHPQPDRALANFEECVATLGARSVFFQLLDESDEALTLFVEICSRTSFIVETLRVYPDLFDEVVDSLLTGRRFDPEDLAREMDALFAPGRSFAQGVFQFKHLHLLLIAIRDLQRLVNLSEVLRQIAELAETILGGVVRASRSAASARFGEWSGPEPRMTVLGLGKLGGQEMNYKSDVDMVLLYEGEGATTRGVGAQEYFERFSHMLLEEAGRADSAGPLLHVDLRLRPLGNHNSLAISTAAWRQYFVAGQARTWERQAFLRARPVAGDRGLAEEVLRFIREELVVGGAAGPASREEAFTDVLEMRRRLEEHAGKGNLKRGRGGIMDVEFLVQGLQLAHGKEHPEILTANTAEGLQSLMAAGILEPRHGSELLTAYQFLRWLENRLALVSEAGERLNSLDGLREEELESLIHKIGYRSSGGESALAIFQSELEYYRRRNRHLLERLLRA